ncbi:hypothetical protein RSA46_12145 [Pseudomonas oryzihabitans]|uniref:hypothetical protein n=1 Tax=Pseudomonas rhizoryzae TaxID=2571129 RepID=UPI0007360009|nr:hypothetical protein [Pseudomonas rhizoryzae]KTT28976.1 hypothetical protein SB9_22695 [Pseudomonas psychrotolerans]KTT34074.1 hypothetical protein NS201_03550 [Pseudomonas psychrotolerans]KTT44411.1 hypothetical protein RSA46_12145 [Pseudomonas psychrotolerans]KTT76292.1 hypothetical protein SB18R_11495 [Pseudomonas psychrotolerans]
MKALLLSSLALWLGGAQAASMSWQELRSGNLYLQTATGDALTVDWRPAWQAAANREQLYLLDGSGHLQQQLDIAADQTRGSARLALPASPLDYRFDVPGYSFRNYRLTHDAATKAQFEPAKLHLTADVAPGVELYFKVGAGEHAVLNGKYQGGVEALVVQPQNGVTGARLPLQRHARYRDFDWLELPVAAQDRVFKLRLIGSGKVSFWLDGTANLFAQDPAQLHPLQQAPGQVDLRLRQDSPGPTPRLGVGLPYAQIPPPLRKDFADLGVQGAGLYSFADVLNRAPQRELEVRQDYRQRFDLDFDVTLLASSGRQAVLEADPQTGLALTRWLEDTRALKGGLHYLSFADEPNLNYPSYAAFSRYFGTMLSQVKAVSWAHAVGVRIAMPASAQFINGPFCDDAASRRGLDWARSLLKEHGPDIDAIAWHRWMLRDLLATRRYRDEIQAAAELVGRDDQGRPRKALLLDQTNISSGDSLSPYEQDTWYAAQWWAAVAIASGQDGLLSLVSWFQLADEDDYPKGLWHNTGTSFAAKPIGRAWTFVRQHWLERVVGLDNDAFEVDALAMSAPHRQGIVGVNKAQRLQQVTLAPAPPHCTSATLELLLPEGPQRSAVSCTAERLTFELPPNALFSLDWSTP